MKRFIYTKCKVVWYSAVSNNSNCEKCGGKLIETDLNRNNMQSQITNCSVNMDS